MAINTGEDTITNISSYFKVKSDKLTHHYKQKVSGFDVWSQKEHAEKWLLFPENIGPNLSIDEVSLSKGELYTFVTNKAGKGKSGTMVACIEGTKSEDIQEVLERIELDKRLIVKEITLNMAKNMEAGVKESFPNASLVTDRFHVVKLALDALQHLRVKERWVAMDAENVDLGDMKNIAEIIINGKNVGTVWKKPFKLDITEAVKAGDNTIQVKVTNTWVNRLVGDAQPDVKNKTTFTTMPLYRTDSPLVPSGEVKVNVVK